MKRLINIFFHNIRVLNRNKKIKYKVRFIVFAFLFITITGVGLFALIKSYAYYNSKVNLALDIETAMYVVEPGEMSYNIDLDKIIPSDTPYIYTFSFYLFHDRLDLVIILSGVTYEYVVFVFHITIHFYIFIILLNKRLFTCLCFPPIHFHPKVAAQKSLAKVKKLLRKEYYYILFSFKTCQRTYNPHFPLYR